MKIITLMHLDIFYKQLSRKPQEKVVHSYRWDDVILYLLTNRMIRLRKLWCRNTKYAVLVVWDCDADRVIWRGDYVFCKFIQSDCCKIGDEKYVSGKYSIDEIQQLSRIGVYCEKTCLSETWNFIKDGWKMYVVFPFYQSNFSTDFSREFSDSFSWIAPGIRKRNLNRVYSA